MTAPAWGAVRVPDICVSMSRDPSDQLLRAWDRLVDRVPGTDVTQLSAWAELRAGVGYTAWYLFVCRGEHLVGGAQILTRRVPVLGTIGYLPYGPLVAPELLDGEAVRRACVEALVTMSSRRLRVFFVQPPEGDHATSAQLRNSGFRTSTAGIAPQGSIRIDLEAELADIRSRFGKRLKYWTNRWESRGVTVRSGDERDIPLLVELMAASAHHQGYEPFSLEYVTALYRGLTETGHAVLFVGLVDGVPVAADLMTGCGGMLRGRLSGFDRSEEAAQLSVPAAIRWEMIRWAKAQGYRWFDFGGLLPETLTALMEGQDRSWEGFPTADQPKLTFGGAAFRYPPAMEMFRPAVLGDAYRLAERSTAGQRLLEEIRSLLRQGVRPPGARRSSGDITPRSPAAGAAGETA